MALFVFKGYSTFSAITLFDIFNVESLS